MAKMAILENGISRKAKKRNPARKSTGTAKSKNPARRRVVSLASAKSVLKRNGLKAVSRTLANGKHKRRRHHKKHRNGITTTRRNGMFGNTKSDVKQVGSLVGGALVTKLVGQVIKSFAAPYIAKIAIVGNYSGIICDLAAALVVTPFVVGKVVKQADASKLSRLGGLTVVALDAIGQFFPSALQYNPFTTSPVVLTGQGATILPAAVAQIANSVANSADPNAAAAKVSGAMAYLNTTQARRTNFAGAPRQQARRPVL